MKFGASLATLALCLAGCSSGPGSETVELRFSDQLYRRAAPPSAQEMAHGQVVNVETSEWPPRVTWPTTPIPDGAVPVHTRVYEVHAPLVDSPSLVGERSVVIFQILPGNEVPGRPRATRIALQYDSANFQPRGPAVFWFTATGEFFAIEHVPPPGS